MDSQITVTAKGKQIGWTCMHNGGFCINPISRYEQHGTYKPATMDELKAAIKRGELHEQFGQRVHVGGILYNFVPNPAQSHYLRFETVSPKDDTKVK